MKQLGDGTLYNAVKSKLFMRQLRVLTVFGQLGKRTVHETARRGNFS